QHVRASILRQEEVDGRVEARRFRLRQGLFAQCAVLVRDAQLVEEADQQRPLGDQQVLTHRVEREPSAGRRAERAAHGRATLVRRVALPELDGDPLVGHGGLLEVSPQLWTAFAYRCKYLVPALGLDAG